MKTFLFFAVCSIFVQLNAQMTINASNMPSVGDSFYSRLDSTIYTPPAKTGGLFNFSNLKNHDTSFTYFLSNNNLVTFPDANLRINVDGDETNDIYMKKTGNDLIFRGANSLALPVALAVPSFNGSLKYLSFPITKTSNVKSKDSLRIALPSNILPPELNLDSLVKTIPGIPSSATVTVDSIVVNIVVSIYLLGLEDGKITTPLDANLDIVKLERTITFTPKIGLIGEVSLGFIKLPLSSFDLTSFFLGQLPDIGLNGTKEHIYLSPNFKQPIVTALVDSMGRYTNTSYRYKTKLGGGSSSISSSLQNDLDIVFENNSIEICQFGSNQNLNYSIFDMSGRQLSQNQFKTHQYSISIKDLAIGIYNLVIYDQEGNLKKSIKWSRM